MDAGLTPLAAARDIADALCASAQWQGDRCTWLEGSTPLDGDLYAGTAGVGWFLGAAARVTGDEVARRTAIGALEHAVAAVAARETPQAGLHGGDLGVLWAAAEVGEQLRSPGLARRARASADKAARRLAAGVDGRCDVLSGHAGTVLAALALGDGTAPGAAGEALLARAEEAPVGLAWPELDEPGAAPVRGVGLAHGAAGVAWALIELARATGDGRFRDAANAGLAFERSWFDPVECGWRDPATGALTGSSWCRGATGIALVRLRALALAPEERLTAEIGAALASVHGAVAAALGGRRPERSGERANFSVCHGLMGIADLLLEASEALGVPEHRHAAERIAEHGLATLQASGSWRCGTLDGSVSPGLMLGLAGIGAVLLRIEEPGAISSPGLLAYSTSPAGAIPRSSP